MLGAKIAIEVIQNNPNLTLAEYQTEYPIIFLNHLKALGAKGAARTAQIMHELDGHWWDSHKRLPDKWVVKTRDYTPRLTIKPHWGDSNDRVTLSFEKFAHLEKWGSATFVAHNQERHFKKLPDNIRKKTTWSMSDLEKIATFAKAFDDKHELSNNHLIMQ